MLQLVFGLFCVVFGGTVVFMKKDQILDLILMGKRYQYADKLYKLDKFVIVLRVLSAIVCLLGLYICVINGLGMILSAHAQK